MIKFDIPTAFLASNLKKTKRIGITIIPPPKPAAIVKLTKIN